MPSRHPRLPMRGCPPAASSSELIDPDALLVRVSVHVMTRAWMLLLVACGSTSETTTSGSGSASTGTGPTRVTVPSNLAANDPAAAVVDRVFPRRPAFPLLSKDGNSAVVEIVTPVARSGGSTYSVGFVTAGADAWSGGEIELTTLVNGMLLALLAEARESGTVATYDADAMSEQAKVLTSRIADGGFQPFESMVESSTGKAAGPFRFKVTDEPTGAITIDITEGAKTIKSEKVEPVSTGLISDVDCLAKPRVKRAFADPARRRLLLHIGWSLPAQCEPPDDKYRLYAPT